MKSVKRVVFVLILGIASLEAHAQRGRGGGACNLDQPVVNTIAEALQDATFGIRQTVSQLPRPELWRPYARPIGMSVRKIRSLLYQGYGYGVCRELASEAYQLNRAFQNMFRQLSAYGRGSYGKELYFAVKHVQLLANELEAAIRTSNYGGIGGRFPPSYPGGGHGGGRGNGGGGRGHGGGHR